MERRPSGSSEESRHASSDSDHRPDQSQPKSKSKSNRDNQPNGHHHSRDSNARSSSARTRRYSTNSNWKLSHTRNGSAGKPTVLTTANAEDDSYEDEKRLDRSSKTRKLPARSPWTLSLLTLCTAAVGVLLMYAILYSSHTLHCDLKGCRMSYMRPSYKELKEFDTEHTRFASKYSLYLYREQGIDNDRKVTGVPVLFIPGNAGSYKQVRPIASEAATYFHDVLQHDIRALESGSKNLDFFTVDFNEDFTAFHGQTILDQAEYLNEAIRYILSLYFDPKISQRDPNLPDPTSVIILGHSMGGIVARTMLVMPNYQADSINSILTLSAPHARPPVTFDAQIVQIYEEINDYWRRAYSQDPKDGNPLEQVTMVSIAGGGLDTVVPSDYAGLESIVPDTHGFTVFTTTIPDVWTSMDHLAILWCDQFRKTIARVLYDIVDVKQATQTRPREERMAAFKKWLLTGMESNTKQRLGGHDQMEHNFKVGEDGDLPIIKDQRLSLPALGLMGKQKTYFMPIPRVASTELKRLTVLSDLNLQKPNDSNGEAGKLDILFCNNPGSLEDHRAMSLKADFFGGEVGFGKLSCHDAAPDTIRIPASTRSTENPFTRDWERQRQPFSYLQYDAADLQSYQFVAFVDHMATATPGWVVAEISDKTKSKITAPSNRLHDVLSKGIKFELPSDRPMVTEIKIPPVQSSLLAYNLEIEEQPCPGHKELFAPMVRQYLSEPYESKYFVNARNAEISLHGVSPYMPPPIKPKHEDDGVSFQFWIDPTCESPLSIRLSVDPLASLGKLHMRYRTIFAAFPLLVVAMVLRSQFRHYDDTGVFLPFSQGLDDCLRRSLPMLLLSLTCLSLLMPSIHSMWSSGSLAGSTLFVDFARNDLLTGTTDPAFWFLVPLIGVVCIGTSLAFHYAILVLIYAFSLVYGFTSSQLPWTALDERKRGTVLPFVSHSPRRRLLATLILLFLVSTLIPYQFAFVVACLVQLTTCVRAFWLCRQHPSLTNSNFSNYTHSIFLLMFWILPINLPTLVVWVRNLAIHWFTPFSSHHNLVSILPFIFLVETLTAGKMIPRIKSRLRHLTNVIFFSLAIYAAVYGVSHAYMLHRLVNMAVLWLVAVHFTADSWGLAELSSIFDSDDAAPPKEAKAP